MFCFFIVYWTLLNIFFLIVDFPDHSFYLKNFPVNVMNFPFSFLKGDIEKFQFSIIADLLYFKLKLKFDFQIIA